jgi:glycosyltransferase involved in cell wall biosynthesis
VSDARIGRSLQDGVRAADAIVMGEAGDDPLVLHAITRLNVGGPARLVLGTHRRIPMHGFRSHLAYGRTARHEAELPPVPPSTLLPSLTRDIRFGADVRALRATVRLIRTLRPDLVHTHLAKAGGLGRLAARVGERPATIHTFHGHVLQDYFSALGNAVFARAERGLARRADALVAVSTSVRDELLAHGIGAPAQWHVVPIGIDLASVDADPDPAHARARLGLPLRGALVGCVGRLVAIKDHETLFRAMKIVVGHRPDSTLVIAGGGDDRPRVESLARELLGDRVRLLGWVDDLRSLYAALDVVALTSVREGAPLALIEAQAAGRPVVATDVGGVADVVRHGRTGMLVPPRDHDAAARAIRDLLQDRDHARAMGAAASRWARARFSEERMVGDLADLYREVLDRRLGEGASKLPRPVQRRSVRALDRS